MTRANSEEQQLEGEQIKRVRSAEGADAEDDDEGDEDGDHGDEDVNVSSGVGESKGEQLYLEQQHPGSNDRVAGSKPKRNPFCSRCRNHGKSAQVKGHKRHCEYRDCQCEGCKLVECRQFVSALQIKRRRYQKQDEECGRRIEISPPVLMSEPSTNPAAMIAKTLIGSKNQQHQHRPLSLHHAPPLMGPKRHQDSSSEQPNESQLFCPITMQPVTTAATASVVTNSANSCQQQQQQQQQQQHYAANTALSNALHLFQLPNSMLSPHNHQHQHRQQQLQQQHQHGPSQPPASQHHHHRHQLQPHQSTSPTLPSPSEQLNLVEEILHSFGPIAIYAWLRAEHFDIQQIHTSIELVRPYYNSLVNLKLNYAHQAVAAAAAAASTATKGADLTATSQHHGTSAVMLGNSSPTSRTLVPADTSGSNSNCSSGGGSGADTVISGRSGGGQFYEGGEVSAGRTPMTLSATATTSSLTNMATTSIDTGSDSAASAPSAAHLSLSATLNSLPMPTASGLLWSGLRSASSTIDCDGNAVIRPLPFLPHFMHQHHHNLFNTASSQAYHQSHHHHHQNNHSQHQQVSPSSTVNNLSTLTSSSSTVL